MSNGQSGREISWVWVILAFVFFWPVGIFLLFMKIFGEKNRGSAYRRPGHPNTYRPAGSSPQQQTWDWRQQAQNVEPRPVQQATPQPRQAAPQPQRPARNYHPGQQTVPPPPPRAKAQPTYNNSYSYNYNSKTEQLKQSRLLRKIAPNKGKGLSIAGWIVLGSGAFSAAVTMLGMMGSWNGLFYSMWVSAIVAVSVCTPGAVMAIVGGRKRERSARCQTLYTMMRGRKTADIREMAAAVPCSYGQATKDLRWMIHEGFFPGAYIDASKGMLIYAGSEPEPQPAEAEPAHKVPPSTPGVFPEVLRIRQLNDDIDDEFVSQRMERLEELTQKIFTYVEANPGKEERIRQFRNHYLPKTIKILESYARFEKQGVVGANIRAAMKDVEEIMDTLTSGFEKQLDMLFVDEALDVTTDINVLESMMGLQGLSSDDPFKLELSGGDLY